MYVNIVILISLRRMINKNLKIFFLYITFVYWFSNIPPSRRYCNGVDLEKLPYKIDFDNDTP